DGRPVATWLNLGEVVAVHIAREFIVEGVYDTALASPVLRGGGPADYFGIGAAQRFRMLRPA
ncbi:MAG: flavin reductase family protein, partial [Burkholderiales bacterium]|nr:flavin reductase family protein [Burkholderiales bacterium]